MISGIRLHRPLGSQFKCNHCRRVIDYRKFGDPEIKCWCGARYTKTITIEVKDVTDEKGRA